MSLLIINTLQEDDPPAQKAIQYFTAKSSKHKIFQTRDMKIEPCIGCNACWLKTPGRCAIRDDYEQILKAYLTYDATVFITSTAFGFMDYKLKNVIDRILPLATMYTCSSGGQTRHIPRYEKQFRFGLVYSGVADHAYLEHWMERFALNFNGISFGVFPMEKYKEVALCI